VKHGKKGLHINCSGLSSSWDKCYTSRQFLRPQRLQGHRQVRGRRGRASDYPFGLNPAGYTSRSMIVICK
jgi:hypothetical protein